MNFRTIIPLFLIFLVTSAALPSYGEQSTDALFEEANRAYSKQDFAAAARMYEEILHTRGYSSGVLYNLAGSYAQLGKTGMAVLNYERALRLSPGNSDIQGNLKLVKSSHGLFGREQPVWEKAARLLTMNQWVFTASGLLGGFTLLLIFSRRFTQLRRLLLPAGFTLSVLIVFALYGAWLHQKEWGCSIVISPNSRLMISPFEEAASIGDIKEGQTVFFMGKQHGEYSYVEDAAGREGWIASSAIVEVVPNP